MAANVSRNCFANGAICPCLSGPASDAVAIAAHNTRCNASNSARESIPFTTGFLAGALFAGAGCFGATGTI